MSLGKTPPVLSRFGAVLGFRYQGGEGAAFGSLAAGPKKGLHPMRINTVAFIGKGGVDRIVEFPLTQEELDKFNNSCNAIRANIKIADSL